MDSAQKTSFHLQDESSSFVSRSKDVFGSLDALEKKHDVKQKELDSQPDSSREQKQLWKADPDDETITGRNSRFKRPSSRPPSHRGSKYRRLANQIPDYKVHPKKWTKYSLEDVESSDLSESSNSRAAFAFLEERRKLREAAEKKYDPEDEGEGGKFVFKKPAKVSGGVNVFSSKRSESSNTKEVNIRHLGEEETDEGDGDITLKKENVVETDCSNKKTSKTSFKKSSKKRSIRARNADVDEDS